MKLLQLGWKKWRVLAICDPQDNCHVLDVLLDLGASNKAVLKMLSDLREVIPERGPDFRNPEKVKHLDDGIYEFRKQPGRGPKPRVYFFRDELNVVVCTEAFAKRDEIISPFIERAKAVRTEYQRAKHQRQIIVDIEPGDRR